MLLTLALIMLAATTTTAPAATNPAQPLTVLGAIQPDERTPRVAGVKHVVVHRAPADGWTYNHHVDMACWKGRLYVAWDACEKDEDVGESRELYSTSEDGEKWSKPALLFPQGVSTAMRMYFFVAPRTGRMLAVAGLRKTTDTPADVKRGGLVVREIRADHSLGDVFTIISPTTQPVDARIPPVFSTSPDRGFVESCEQLLADKPFLEQQDYGRLLGERRMKWHDLGAWPADEPSREHFPNRFGKGMCFFHRKDGALVSIMKWGWVMVSHDGGETWSQPVRPPTLVSGMAKAWGQRTRSGNYVLFYNPHLENRFPLVMVHGHDGITFGDMRIVNGDRPPMRHPGLYKVEGPQYVRGISEWSSDGSRRDDDVIWIAYSMNKEDIYVSRVPSPAP